LFWREDNNKKGPEMLQVLASLASGTMPAVFSPGMKITWYVFEVNNGLPGKFPRPARFGFVM
jgi:hypothetical protein